MAAPTFDLQSHSVHSDGALTPARVVAAAAAAGVELLALSDHDTVDGVADAQAAAREPGLRLVPAVELSSVDPLGEDLHILGYGIDPADARARRAPRGLPRRPARRASARMADAMEELGWALDRSAVRATSSRPGARISRPRRSAIPPTPGGSPRRASTDSSALLVAYLIPTPPRLPDRARSRPSPTRSRRSTTRAASPCGRIPSGTSTPSGEVEEALRRFAAGGMDGVEAFYIEHGERQTTLLCDLADELGLLTTGSADFHGPEHPHFSRFRAFELFGREPRLGPIAGA